MGLSWQLNVPGIVWLMRTPLLNMLSHNRFVFAASFTILAMAAVGLQRLYEGKVLRRWWFFLPATVLAGLTLFMLSWTAELPEHLWYAPRSGDRTGPHFHRAELDRIQGSFVGIYLFAAALGGLGLAGWLLLWFRPHLQRCVRAGAGDDHGGRVDLLWLRAERNAIGRSTIRRFPCSRRWRKPRNPPTDG